ncbi:MAG: hypothetical protein AAGG44_06260 [Planctomycetota bacterium]
MLTPPTQNRWKLPGIVAIFLALFIGGFCVSASQEACGESEVCEVELEEALVRRPAANKRDRQSASIHGYQSGVDAETPNQPIRAQNIASERAAHNGHGGPLLI